MVKMFYIMEYAFHFILPGILSAPHKLELKAMVKYGWRAVIIKQNTTGLLRRLSWLSAMHLFLNPLSAYRFINGSHNKKFSIRSIPGGKEIKMKMSALC